MADGTAMDASGRRQEFEALTFEHLPALYGFAWRLTRHAQDAEDLVQEAYLRAFRFFEQFQRGTNVKAWLFRILKNAFINEYRRRKPQPSADVDVEGIDQNWDRLLDEGLLSRVEDPEEALGRTLLGEEVEAAMAELPDEYRLVVLLVLVQGFSYQEAADILEVPTGTVMSRLHRGRRLLQTKLADQARERGFGAGASAGGEKG